ncbi:MAG: LysE family transporter [Candidatus Bathyarchaeota archaeon]|jgi:threonine/homoserine/homoserine lactone efflux protein
MEALDFILTIVLVTASGALAPGPLFVANLSKGSKYGAKSGFIFSFAHNIVEFTLVMLLAFGLLFITNHARESVKFTVGIAGGIMLIIFGVIQIYKSVGSQQEALLAHDEREFRGLLVLGLTLTGLNPFFIIWWLTAGAQLIIISLEFASIAGVLLMYVCHVWMDYLWLILTAQLAKTGMNIVGYKGYRFLIAIFGGILIYFGLTFLSNSLLQ